MSNIFLNNLPHTTEGAALVLTKEQEEYCRVVYELDDQGGAVFSDLWNPSMDYSDNFIIAPLRSTYLGLSKEYPIGTHFANIKGSSDDPKPDASKTWYQFIKDILAPEDYKSYPCCAENKLYAPFDNSVIERAWIGEETIPDSFVCCGKAVGGHVLMETKYSAKVLMGQTVCLLPICENHNIAHLSAGGRDWGCGYYMKLVRKMKAVMVKDYLCPRSLIND